MDCYMQKSLGQRGDLNIPNQDYLLTSTTSPTDTYGLAREVFCSYEIMHAQDGFFYGRASCGTSVWIQAESDLQL